MKKTLIPALILLFSTLLIAAMPTEAEARIYDDTLRLHILANSDSDEDQALKLALRDELLREYGHRLSACDSIDGAESAARSYLDEIESFANEYVRSLGYDYDVEATITTEWYDTRNYEDFSLPAGYYSSLRVIIGNGEGQNWWCIMYPPLCMDIATESSPADDGIIDYTKEELTLIKSNGYNVKFKVLEILSHAFRKK